MPPRYGFKGLLDLYYLKKSMKNVKVMDRPPSWLFGGTTEES